VSSWLMTLSGMRLVELALTLALNAVLWWLAAKARKAIRSRRSASLPGQPRSERL
jgi:hypothetical protein